MPAIHDCQAGSGRPTRLHDGSVCIRDVTKTFPDSAGREFRVLDRLSLCIEGGGVTSLVGPSGCGKSTLLQLIAGLMQADSGSVQFQTAPASFSFERRPTLGFMFQRDHLLPWRTVAENALIGVQVQRRATTDDRLSVEKLLVQFGLEGFADAYPETLSEGMRQRVALIRTLMVRPQLLLLDEPFSSIDYHVKLQLEAELLRRVQAEAATMVFVTHDLEDAIVMGNRIAVLSARPARLVGVYDTSGGPARRDPLHFRRTEEFRTLLARLATDVLGPA